MAGKNRMYVVTSGCMNNKLQVQERIRKSAMPTIKKCWPLWNSKVKYRAHKNPPQVILLWQLNGNNTLTFCFFKVHFNIISPFPTRSSECFSPHKVFRKRKLVHFSHLFILHDLPSLLSIYGNNNCKLLLDLSTRFNM
jgi:hypothetical protein